jgi:hypothetical protein
MRLVFAYGSNLCLPRIRERVASAVPLDIGFVSNRKLVFHKKSADGSAKADARDSCNHDDRVWGVVYRLTPADKLLLDEHEFLGVGYDELLVEVEMHHRTLEAWMYVARESAICNNLKPYCWYREYVRLGAIQHGLPEGYVESIADVEPMIDPDDQRRTHHHAIIDRVQPRA